jgi:geranylgeranyl pyrophosphate synthase
MWQNRQLELLRAEIVALLTPLSSDMKLYALAKEPLTKARRGLAAEEGLDRPWPLLLLIVCEAISRSCEHALPAAAALQLLMAAGDVFDDIEDADSPESLSARYGSAVATNIATTLLILAERAVTRLKGRGVNDNLIIRVMDAVNSFYATACAGQHLDLSLPSEIAGSEDTYLRVIGMKSASQIECACHVGALLAPANEEMVGKFSAFGHNLGMAAQITNDIQGIKDGSDIAKHKITLPVIYALAQTDGEVRDHLELAFGKPSKSAPDIVQIRDLMFHIGAIHYATISIELYKQRALDILSEVEGAGARTERLKLFLE